MRENYAKWVNIVKRQAIRHRVPLRAELWDLVDKSHVALGYAAERESLGFNDRGGHPDIYMAELIDGMHLLYRVLPAVLKKLDISRETLDLEE